jgi:hypothetical protein
VNKHIEAAAEDCYRDRGNMVAEEELRAYSQIAPGFLDLRKGEPPEGWPPNEQERLAVNGAKALMVAFAIIEAYAKIEVMEPARGVSLEGLRNAAGLMVTEAGLVIERWRDK